MSNLTNDPHALSQVLQMLSANDTNIIKQGESLLKPMLKSPECISALMLQITQSPDAGIRSQAALLLKRKIYKLYVKLSENNKSQLRSQLLSIFVSDQTKVVGNALAGSLAAVGKAILIKEKKQWPELFQTLLNLSQNPDPRLRSLNFSLLAQLAENASKALIPHTKTLCAMFVTGCEDSIPDVSIEAMKATTTYIDAISNNEIVMELKPALTPILNVLSICLQRGDEDMVIDGLEIFQECGNMEFPLINDHLNVIVPFLIEIIKSDNLDIPVKQSASETFVNIVENRPKLIGKLNLAHPCLEAFVGIIAKSKGSAAGNLFNFQLNKDLDESAEEDDEDFTESDIQRIAQVSIDAMAINLPSKYFVQPALTICSQCLSSQDPQFRKAGCALLGVITEGCSESIRPMLDSILPSLLNLIQDEAVYVRECAGFALGQLSEHCQPEILFYHASVLPKIFQSLDDPNVTVQGTSCYVLEMFCENLQPETLRPFLNPLMQRLISLIQSRERSIKEMVLAAIAATAVAAESDFIPYAETTISILSPLLFLTDQKDFETRGRALECLGHIALALGDTHFTPYFSIGIQSAMQATAINDETLKEFSYIYIANCVKAMTYAFSSFLPTLVPHLLDVINESELTKAVDSDEEEDEQNNAVTSNENEEDDDNEVYDINVEEGFINTKKAALTALGALAQYTKENFAPYLDKSLLSITHEEIGSITSLHEFIKAESVECLQYFVLVGKYVIPELKDFKPTKGVAITIPNDSLLYKLITHVFPIYIKIIHVEHSKKVVALAIEGMNSILENIGLAVIMVQIKKYVGEETNSNETILLADEIMKMIFLLLSEKLPCQGQSDDPNDDDDDHDHDNDVMEAVVDLIGTLAKVIGQNFLPYFDEFYKLLMKFMKPNKSYSDRAMAIGCFAEVMIEIGPPSLKYTEILLPNIQLGLQDTTEGLRRNSAYCIAAIIEALGNNVTGPQVIQFLQLLYPLCTRSQSKQSTDVGGADIDNALSAVTRLIKYASPKGLIPLQQVLPVIIDALPIRSDPLEGPSIYGCLIDLITNMEPNTLNLLPQLLILFGNTIASDSKAISNETRALIKLSLQNIAQTNNNLMNIISSSLSQISDSNIRTIIENSIFGR